MTWSDSENRYEFRPAELQMNLAPGETAAAEFRAIPRQRRLFGGSRIDVYSVKIAPDGGQPQSHTGQIVTTGLLPVWAAASILLLLVMCAVGTGAVAFAMLGPAPTATPAMMGMGTEIVGSSDSSFHFHQSHCALGLEGTSRELCEAMMTVDKSRVSRFLGKEVEMKILKTGAAGDEKCDVVFSTIS